MTPLPRPAGDQKGEWDKHRLCFGGNWGNVEREYVGGLTCVQMSLLIK